MSFVDTLPPPQVDSSTTSLLTLYKRETRARLRVLRSLGHITNEGIVTAKGRIAAEVEAVDELVLSELIFDGVFLSLTPQQIAALLSCLFDFEKNSGDKRPLSPPLAKAYDTLVSTVTRVIKYALCLSTLIYLFTYSCVYSLCSEQVLLPLPITTLFINITTPAFYFRIDNI